VISGKLSVFDIERHLREEEKDLEDHQRRCQKLVEMCDLEAEQVYRPHDELDDI
jgi:hypothetical protein